MAEWQQNFTGKLSQLSEYTIEALQECEWEIVSEERDNDNYWKADVRSKKTSHEYFLSLKPNSEPSKNGFAVYIFSMLLMSSDSMSDLDVSDEFEPVLLAIDSKIESRIRKVERERKANSELIGKIVSIIVALIIIVFVANMCSSSNRPSHMTDKEKRDTEYAKELMDGAKKIQNETRNYSCINLYYSI